MSKKKSKKRKVKQSVKNIILFILILFLLVLLFIYLFSDNNNDDDINRDNMIVEEDLKRYDYKDGFYYEKLSSKIKKRITGNTYPKSFSSSYQSISYNDLRYLRLRYYDFDGNIHNDGELIVNKNVAKEVIEIFYKLYEGKYAFAKIRLVDDYGGDDFKSMEDNNTSAFNYRILEDGKDLSWHAFGLAIDINPLYNPYILGNDIYPSNGEKYTNRYNNFVGKIDYNDLAYIVFSEYGWKWGGDFISSKDYQHFYKEIYDNSVREMRNE